MPKQLWAPWRLEYVSQADELPGCPLCAEANGEVETTTFALFCLGFFISRLLRRCFCDIGSLMAAC